MSSCVFLWAPSFLLPSLPSLLLHLLPLPPPPSPPCGWSPWRGGGAVCPHALPSHHLRTPGTIFLYPHPPITSNRGPHVVSKRSFTFCSTVAKVGGSLLPCGHPRKQGKACENGQKKIGPLGCDPTLAYSCTGKSLHNVMKRNFHNFPKKMCTKYFVVV